MNGFNGVDEGDPLVSGPTSGLASLSGSLTSGLDNKEHKLQFEFAQRTAKLKLSLRILRDIKRRLEEGNYLSFPGVGVSSQVQTTRQEDKPNENKDNEVGEPVLNSLHDESYYRNLKLKIEEIQFIRRAIIAHYTHPVDDDSDSNDISDLQNENSKQENEPGLEYIMLMFLEELNALKCSHSIKIKGDASVQLQVYVTNLFTAMENEKTYIEKQSKEKKSGSIAADPEAQIKNDVTFLSVLSFYASQMSSLAIKLILMALKYLGDVQLTVERNRRVYSRLIAINKAYCSSSQGSLIKPSRTDQGDEDNAIINDIVQMFLLNRRIRKVLLTKFIPQQERILKIVREEVIEQRSEAEVAGGKNGTYADSSEKFEQMQKVDGDRLVELKSRVATLRKEIEAKKYLLNNTARDGMPNIKNSPSFPSSLLRVELSQLLLRFLHKMERGPCENGPDSIHSSLTILGAKCLNVENEL